MSGEIIHPYLAPADAGGSPPGAEKSKIIDRPNVDVDLEIEANGAGLESPEVTAPIIEIVETPSPNPNINYRIRRGTESKPRPKRREGTIFTNTGVRIARRDNVITRLTRVQDKDKERFRRTIRAFPHIVGVSIPELDRDVTGVTKHHAEVKDPERFVEIAGDRLEEFARSVDSLILTVREEIRDGRGQAFTFGKTVGLINRALDYAGITPEAKRKLLQLRHSVEITNRDLLKAEIYAGRLTFPDGVVNVEDTIEVRPTKRRKPRAKRIIKKPA